MIVLTFVVAIVVVFLIDHAIRFAIFWHAERNRAEFEERFEEKPRRRYDPTLH